MATWGVAYYRDPAGHVPAAAFLERCPRKVRATILAVLDVVRQAPPPAFSGGGKWEAMRGAMRGYYEVRVTGPGRRQYRLFCKLENGSLVHLARCRFGGPMLVAINGLDKPNASLFTEMDYRKHVRRLGDDYAARLPRPVAD